jgi:phenylacetate-coenzyme A ligase PaaK-like adenylate-forming protein
LFSLPHRKTVSREQIVAFQNERLRGIISHAYEKVPYYRALFDRNRIKPTDIRTVSDLSIIPVTTKKDLQLLPESQIVARGFDPRKLILRRTSGSTGQPFTTRRTWREERLLGLYRMRIMRDLGQRLTDRVGGLGLVRPLHPRDRQFPLNVLQSLGFFRSLRVNRLLPQKEILRALRDFKPDILTGPPCAFLQLAQAAGPEDRKALNPRFIRTNGEVLTRRLRKEIVEIFGAPVFEMYASHEFRIIAWECRETGELHVCDDAVVVEIEKDGHPVSTGDRGQMIGTALHSYAMPFIRFNLGDIVTKGAEICPCGQPFSTIRGIQGRLIDYFPLPGGRWIHSYDISFPLLEIPWVTQYQLLQERQDRIILRIVSSRDSVQHEVDRMKKSVADMLGQGIDFQVVLVPEIKPEANGKFRVSHSLVRTDYPD